MLSLLFTTKVGTTVTLIKMNTVTNFLVSKRHLLLYHVEEWRYSSTRSLLGHQIEVSRQLHAPVPLLIYESPVPTGYEIGWVTETIWTFSRWEQVRQCTYNVTLSHVRMVISRNPVSGTNADTCEQTDRRKDMTQLICDFRHYANAPENRLLAQEMKRRFIGRPFCNLVCIPSSFGSEFHALTNASLHHSAIFVYVGGQRHAGIDVQYCVGLYGVCMSVPREGTQNECKIREERSYSGDYHEHSECKYPRNDCKILRYWMRFSNILIF